MKNMGGRMGVRPVAVFSKADGTVDVMFDCDLIGQVFVRVAKDKNGKFDSDIVETGETNWGAVGPFGSYVSAKVNLRQAGIKAVKHCLELSNEWVIVGQEDEFDILALKRNLPADKLQESSSYKTRFPLFKSSAN